MSINVEDVILHEERFPLSTKSSYYLLVKITWIYEENDSNTNYYSKHLQTTVVLETKKWYGKKKELLYDTIVSFKNSKSEDMISLGREKIKELMSFPH